MREGLDGQFGRKVAHCYYGAKAWTSGEVPESWGVLCTCLSLSAQLLASVSVFRAFVSADLVFESSFLPISLVRTSRTGKESSGKEGLLANRAK